MTRRAPLKRRADEITFPRQVSRTEKITSEVKSQVRGGDGGHPSATTDERCGENRFFFFRKKKKKKKKQHNNKATKTEVTSVIRGRGGCRGERVSWQPLGAGCWSTAVRQRSAGAASRCAREREHWMRRRRGRGGVGRRRRRRRREGGCIMV